MLDLLLATVAETPPQWMRLLRIETTGQAIWVIVGLTGQCLFFARMGVQWIVSERRGESIVPPVFWWCSLAGAAMLLTYFIWRADIVGILGQSFGFLVYWRNLHLIYVKSRQVPVTADVEPEPELAEPRMTGRRLVRIDGS